MLSSEDFCSELWSVLHGGQGDPNTLEAILTQLEKDDIALFYNEYLRAAATLRNTLEPYLRIDSDDVKKDICEFIVAQGKDAYDDVIQHPERLPEDVDSNDVWVKGITIGVYWDRFHEHIPRYDLGEG